MKEETEEFFAKLNAQTDKDMRECIANGNLDCIDIFDLEEFATAFCPDLLGAIHYLSEGRFDILKEAFCKHYSVSF